jgi:TRAP transporter TAXI family solute receptor
MRLTLALGACLLAFAATAVAAPRVKDDLKSEAKELSAAATSREAMRARANQNVVTIMAGSPSGTDLAIVQDIASILDDGDDLRIVPMVGRGPAQNVKDVIFLRGVDMGITQANIIKYFARTGELGPNLEGQITYIAKLFNEEMHILVRTDVPDIKALEGKPVNFGAAGSGTEITGRLIFEALGIKVEERHLPEPEAIEKVRSGELAASIVVTGKPAPVLASLKDATGLKLLAVPYAKSLEDSYYPGTLTHDDYPALVPEGASVDTVSVCAVLVSFNWNSDNPRYKKLAKFVDRFFTHFDQLMQTPHHPKWREVNFAATLEGWKRSPLAQQWIDRTRATADRGEAGDRKSFDSFLAQAAPTGVAISEEERANLFKAFLEWSKSRNGN